MRTTKDTLEVELHELVRGFLRSLDGRVEKIRNPLLHENPESARFAAHQLKGTAKSFGFPRIAEISDRLESAIATSQPFQRLNDLLEQLEAAVKSERNPSIGPR